MKYCVQEFKLRGKNAGNKAVRDVTQILKECGYKSLNIISKFPYLHLLRLFLTLKKGDCVILQWPIYSYSMELLVNVLVTKQVQLTLLIHDLNSLRNCIVNSFVENKLMHFAKKIIVHTNAMKQYLENLGIESSKMSVLTSFDYLTNDNLRIRQYSNEVVYAGNLSKSTFLQKIPNDSFGIKFNCYGLPAGIIPKHLTYKGTFMSENVSMIEGSWGVVWDGDSISTCDGSIGEYVKVNSPHKVSLYIVSGLPIIIWKYAGLADYIVERKLGIVIESLSDIQNAIMAVSMEQYQEMLVSIREEAEILKLGGHLKNVI